MRYTEFAPPPRLARWVECVWRSENPEPVPGFQVLPDGCLGDLIYSAGASEEEGFVQAVGAMTVSQRFDQPARTLTGIRFHPGMAGPFLGVSPAELTDRTIAASGLPRRKLLQPPADQPNPVQRAIEALTRAAGDLDLEYVARQTNLSQRASFAAAASKSRTYAEPPLPHSALPPRLPDRRSCSQTRVGPDRGRNRLFRSGASDPRFSRIRGRDAHVPFFQSRPRRCGLR